MALGEGHRQVPGAARGRETADAGGDQSRRRRVRGRDDLAGGGDQGVQDAGDDQRVKACGRRQTGDLGVADVERDCDREQCDAGHQLGHHVVPVQPGQDTHPHLGLPSTASTLRALDLLASPISVESADRCRAGTGPPYCKYPLPGRLRRGRALTRRPRHRKRDGLREPRRLLTVAGPDYLKFGCRRPRRLFRALTNYLVLERLLQLQVPTLAVIGSHDPLMPTPERIRQIASQNQHPVVLVVIEEAAHAINFSHTGELAHVIPPVHERPTHHRRPRVAGNGPALRVAPRRPGFWLTRCHRWEAVGAFSDRGVAAVGADDDGEGPFG